MLPSCRCPAAPPPHSACRLPSRRRPAPERCPRGAPRAPGAGPARHPPVGHLLPEGEAPQLLLQRLLRCRQPRILRDPGGTRRLPTTLSPPAAAATRRPRLLPTGCSRGIHCGGAQGPRKRRGWRGQTGGGQRLQALGGGGGREAAAPGAAGRAASRGGCKWQRDRAASIGGRTAAGHCGKLPAAPAPRHAQPPARQCRAASIATPPQPLPRPATPRPLNGTVGSSVDGGGGRRWRGAGTRGCRVRFWP